MYVHTCQLTKGQALFLILNFVLSLFFLVISLLFECYFEW